MNILHIRSVCSATEQLPFQRTVFCNRKSLLYTAFRKFIEMDTKAKTILKRPQLYNLILLKLTYKCFGVLTPNYFPKFPFSTALRHRVVLSSPLCKLGGRGRKTYKICLEGFAIFASLQVTWTDPHFAKN